MENKELEKPIAPAVPLGAVVEVTTPNGGLRAGIVSRLHGGGIVDCHVCSLPFEQHEKTTTLGWYFALKLPYSLDEKVRNSWRVATLK
jgi:hypothetical protein